MKPRIIAVIVGSTSDLPQCQAGLELLKSREATGNIKVEGVYVRSIHRMTEQTLQLVRDLAPRVDVLITGAGWANHLTGTVDAYLRYMLRNDTVVVLGVAFGDPDYEILSTAAKLSISEVPGTQVVFRGSGNKQFFGGEGFTDACVLAAIGALPKIELPPLKEPIDFTVEAALQFIREQKPKEVK